MGVFEPQRSYKHGSYKKIKRVVSTKILSPVRCRSKNSPSSLPQLTIAMPTKVKWAETQIWQNSEFFVLSTFSSSGAQRRDSSRILCERKWRRYQTTNGAIGKTKSRECSLRWSLWDLSSYRLLRIFNFAFLHRIPCPVGCKCECTWFCQ